MRNSLRSNYSGGKFLTRLDKIFLYQDCGDEPVDYAKLKAWLEKFLRRKNLIELRQDLFSFHLSSLSSRACAERTKQIAKELARIRIRNPEQRSFPRKASAVEIDFESRNLLREKRISAAVYDAFYFMNIIAGLIPQNDKGLNFLHILITEQMIASFEPGDRYHLRSAFYGYPCIISTIGLVEAPARPREFYLKISAGIPKELALAELKDSVLKPKDPRLTEILKSQILQAVFYQITGSPHCDRLDCMLYNAHWQEELLKSQFKGKLCKKHQKELSEYLKI